MRKYKLNIDPRILELLGPNLYTNIYYVLAELIANAYDADASNVYIFSNKDDIRVEDDGHGMSYNDGEITQYLHVAAVSRTNESDSYTRKRKRLKIGRKGVGKLAALSVSENVDILTVAKGEKSGFVLSRRPERGNRLKAIAEEDIAFERIKEHGTAIVMRSPQYRLHKTLGAAKRNLLKIFPLVDSSFRIHLIRGTETEIIDDFESNVMKELCTLITLGKGFSSLSALIPDSFPERRSELVSAYPTKKIPVHMADNNGKEHEYSLEIEGWIGTYKSTKGRKVEMTDFPDNFISLFAHKKMGEFNILPVVGQNKLNEVYVVGQLHVDLFELSELPDMALSNRQGYKTDDPRYEAVLGYIRKDLLQDILKRRDKYVDLSKKDKKTRDRKKLSRNEERLRQMYDRFKKDASKKAAERVVGLGRDSSPEAIERAVFKVINETSPDLGMKTVVDSQKKKILISQTYGDKPFSDIIYQMLLYNGVPAEDILYTNCDDEICRVPEGSAVYDYLREFFVQSYSTERIHVMFVTSQNTKRSWGAITEVGASWITQIDHKIFNIHPFRPEHPLNDELQWQSTNREQPTSGELWMIKLNADIFCQKIEAVCNDLKYKAKSRSDNMDYLATLVSIRNS